jgi:hypothetical protein
MGVNLHGSSLSVNTFGWDKKLSAKRSKKNIAPTYYACASLFSEAESPFAGPKKYSFFF